eukprot:2052170-Amphidinium_carterae.1
MAARDMQPHESCGGRPIAGQLSSPTTCLSHAASSDSGTIVQSLGQSPQPLGESAEAGETWQKLEDPGHEVEEYARSQLPSDDDDSHGHQAPSEAQTPAGSTTQPLANFPTWLARFTQEA